MQSKYGDKELSQHQFLAEYMCERIAKKEQKALPYKFWNIEFWNKKFVLQAIHAAKLLKQYEFSVIMTALKHPKAQRIYSLGAVEMLRPFLEEAKAKNAKTDEQPIMEVVENSVDEAPKVFTKKSKKIAKDLW